MFSHTTAMTREELVAMAVSIIRDTPNDKAHFSEVSDSERRIK